MPTRPLRFTTFLAPNVHSVYECIARSVGARLGMPTELVVGNCYDELAEPPDVGFVCGLAYVELARRGVAPIEPIAAPLLQGERYGGRPVYFSDVITHRKCPAQSFCELRGRSWAYNEPFSHSGYGLTRYHLARQGETRGFFGKVVEAGWHQEAVRLVASAEVDAAAIDSQVLAVMLRDQPELHADLRIIDTLGPSTIQPVVVARRLPGDLKEAVRAALLALGDDPAARPHLDHGFVDRFVPVDDASYDDIRAMHALCEAADFLTLH